jgi:hypothetical protein
MADCRVLRVAIAAMFAAAALACGGSCGLGLRDRVTAQGTVAPGGGSFFQDVALKPERGDMEIDLANTAHPAQLGLLDAYLTNTNCAKLFDGPYPGSTPLCKVLVGPVAPGKVSARASLDTGTYRLWIYGYTSNTGSLEYLIDVDIWDSSCRNPIG